MSNKKPPRKAYPSDLTDAQWTILEPTDSRAARTPGDAP